MQMYASHSYQIAARICAGFLLVVLLMVALTFVGLDHITQVKSQMKHIVESNTVKIELAQVMQNALQERALSMHSIAVLEDAFLKDDEFMRFNELGVSYYNARKKLEELSTTPEELMILANIRELTRQTQPKVSAVVELGLQNNNHQLILDKIRKEAIPKQRLIAVQVSKLVSLQREQANEVLNNAQLAYKNARDLMLLLGGLAVLLGVFIGVFVIRRVMKQANLLEHQALHDELTGLANRSLFQDRLKKAILRGQRQGSPFSIILIDLNRFKQVNDSLGHQVGDLLLQEVARRLKSHVRKMDTVARLGGDEYVIILESLPPDSVIQLAEKLVVVIKQPFLLAGQEIDVGVSMGIASYPLHGQDCMTLINRADAAMYEAKRKGIPFICYTDYIQKSSQAI